MDDLKAMSLGKEIDRQMRERKDELIKGIMEGAEETDSFQEIYAKMVCNAISISAKLSIISILDMLADLRLIDLADEDQARKSILKSIK